MRAILKSLLFPAESHCFTLTIYFLKNNAFFENSRGLAEMVLLNENCHQSYHQQSTIYLI